MGDGNPENTINCCGADLTPYVICEMMVPAIQMYGEVHLINVGRGTNVIAIAKAFMRGLGLKEIHLED